MNVFQTTLLSKIAEKKNQLISISSQKKSSRSISSTTETEGETILVKEVQAEHPPLDYSTNKVLRQIKEFEEERLKKKQKAFKETPPV